MAFKLIKAAYSRWRAVNTPHLIALVRAGATFKNGKLFERPHGLADYLGLTADARAALPSSDELQAIGHAELEQR